MKAILAVLGLIGELWTRERRCNAHLVSDRIYPYGTCASCGHKVR